MTYDAAHAMGLTPVIYPERYRNILEGDDVAAVRIGIVDSGWDVDLRSCPINFGPGLDLTRGTLDSRSSTVPEDAHGHGTACVSTSFRMCPDAEYTVLRVFGATLTTPLPRVVRAIEIAVELGCDVISLSLRATTVAQRHALMLYDVCRSASDAGVVLLAASPPDGRLSLPAAFDCVIGVTMANHLLPCEFDYIEDRPAEIAAAPGIEGRVLWRGGAIRELRRTSFGTAIICGLVGRIKARYPNADTSTVRRILRSLSSKAT